MAKKLFTSWENFSQFFTLGSGHIPKGKTCIVVPSRPPTILTLYSDVFINFCFPTLLSKLLDKEEKGRRQDCINRDNNSPSKVT